MSPSRCPVCDKAKDQAYSPFCSKRCADVDLSRWLSGSYVVRGLEDGEDAGQDRGASAMDPLP